jgi:hypothetical protein
MQHWIVWTVLALAGSAFAQPVRIARPPLFLKEEWKQVPSGGEHPATQAAVSNPDLELSLYGIDSKDIQLTGEARVENNPIHIYTGLCTTSCGATLRDKNNYVDLTVLGRVRWVIKGSGFHRAQPLVKLADGTWLVGDHTDGSSADWLVNEFSIPDVRWLKIDPVKLLPKGLWVEKLDLSKVDEIGFVDLMAGGQHGPGGYVDVARIEVYGKPVKRDSSAKAQ